MKLSQSPKPRPTSRNWCIEAMMDEEIAIARDNKPLAMLVPIQRPAGKRIPGSGKGQVLFMADDFDAIPEGFEIQPR